MPVRLGVLFATIALLSGSAYLLIGVVSADLAPLVVAAARCGLGAMIVIPVARRYGALDDLRGRIGALLILGLLEFAVPFTLLSFASRWIPSSLSGVLMATGPLFAVAAALRVDPAEHVSRTRAVGLIMGMAGVLCLLGVEVTGKPEALIGAGFALLASGSFAFGAVHFHTQLSGVAPLGAVGGALVAGAVLLAAPAALALPHHPPHPHLVAALLMLCVTHTALNYVLFFRLVDAIGAARASVTSYVSPAVAVVLGVIFLHEPSDPGIVAGLLLVIVGSWMSTGGKLPPGMNAPFATSIAWPKTPGRTRKPTRSTYPRPFTTNHRHGPQLTR